MSPEDKGGSPGDDDQFQWAPEQYVPVGMRISPGEPPWDIDYITENGSYHFSQVSPLVFAQMSADLIEAEERDTPIDELFSRWTAESGAGWPNARWPDARDDEVLSGWRAIHDPGWADDRERP
jgi:hypothetical protein